MILNADFRRFKFSIRSMLLLFVLLAGGFASWSETHPWILETTVDGLLPARPFSKDGTRLLAGSEDGRILIYEFPSGQLKKTIRSHKGRVYPVFSAGDDYIVTIGQDEPGRSVRIYDAQTGGRLLSRPHDAGECGGISADGHLCVLRPLIVGKAYVYQFWDTETRGKSTIPSLDRKLDSATLVGISPEGKFLVFMVRYDNDVVWDVHAGREVLRIDRVPRPVDHVPTFIRFSPDGKTMFRTQSICAEVEGHVELWNTESWTKRAVDIGGYGMQGRFEIHFSEDSRLVAVSTEESKKTVWIDVPSAKVVRAVPFHDTSRSPDGILVVTATSVIDCKTGKTVFVFPRSHQRNYGVDRNPLGCGWSTNFSALPRFSVDGRYIVRAGGHTIEFWRERHRGDVTLLGRWVACVSGFLLIVSLVRDNAKRRPNYKKTVS
jgi:WD40 repeat protein